MVKISGIQGPNIHFASNQFRHAEKPAEPKPVDVKFGAETAQNAEEPKKKFGIKKLTNILGTVAGITIIGASAYSLIFGRPKWMKLQGRQKALETKITSEATRYRDAIEINNGTQKRGGFLYRLGHKTNALVDRIGEELSNNLL